MPTIPIDLDDEEIQILEKRGKTNFLTLKEQIEDIIRRSCLRTTKSSSSGPDCDDRLVSVFSRKKSGKKK